MTVLGRAIIQTEGLHDGILNMIQKDQESRKNGGRSIYWAHIYDKCRENKELFDLLNKLYDNEFSIGSWLSRDHPIEQQIRETTDKTYSKIRDLISRSEEFSSPMKCLYSCELFDVISLGSEKSTVLLPSGFVSVTKYKDYENLSAAERQMLLNGNTDGEGDSYVAVYGGSITEARSVRDNAAANVASLKQEMQDVKDAKTAELAELQREIDEKVAALEAKKANMMEDLNRRMEEMQLQLEKMELQVHLLDSEIYAIRCYTGEIVEFHKIRSGVPASPKTPLVFYQRLRYLDEELGKLASVYKVDFSKHKIFDKLLQHSPAALNLFAPSDRSIMLARVSKSGKHFSASEAYVNALDDYEVYHGKRICIILRDGENLWTAWTDDERVNFSEDAFLRPSEARPMTEQEARKWEKEEYETEKNYEKRIRAMKMQNLNEGLSRMFVFSILQGVIDRGMIQFPEKVNVQKQNPYVLFSYADGWLDDNRYGTLSEILKRINENVVKGDMILTVQSLQAEQPRSYNGSYRDPSWHNDRGIGDKNRTHDVYCHDRTIYPINKIVHLAEYKVVYTDTTGADGDLERESTLTDEELNNHLTNGRWGHYKITSYECLGNDEIRYYISLEKDENWRTGAVSRANFQVYDDEFWNLTYMNSVVIEYLLSTQKTEGIHIGGQRVDFAHVIPYLKTALEHVREREEEFAKWMEEIVPGSTNDHEWPVKLSDWMLENDIHNFSKFRAKQFVNWLTKNK